MTYKEASDRIKQFSSMMKLGDEYGDSPMDPIMSKLIIAMETVLPMAEKYIISVEAKKYLESVTGGEDE